MARYIMKNIFPDRDIKEPAKNFSSLGEFVAIDQHLTNFTNWEDAKLDWRGFIYIPYTCYSEDQDCAFHMHLHGCNEGAGLYEETYARMTGLMEFAATNNIIVSFPQNNDKVYIP